MIIQSAIYGYTNIDVMIICIGLVLVCCLLYVHESDTVWYACISHMHMLYVNTEYEYAHTHTACRGVQMLHRTISNSEYECELSMWMIVWVISTLLLRTAVIDTIHCAVHCTHSVHSVELHLYMFMNQTSLCKYDVPIYMHMIINAYDILMSVLSQ